MAQGCRWRRERVTGEDIAAMSCRETGLRRPQVLPYEREGQMRVAFHRFASLAAAGFFAALRMTRGFGRGAIGSTRGRPLLRRRVPPEEADGEEHAGGEDGEQDEQVGPDGAEAVP